MTKSVEIKISQTDNALDKFNQLYDLINRGLKAGTVVVTLGREKRSNPQNKRLWATLTDISTQVEWYGSWLSPEDWKHVFTAALTKQRVVPAIDGGFVVLGQSTSKMSKEQFTDLLELIHAFGAEREVKWSDPALEAFEEYLKANIRV